MNVGDSIRRAARLHGDRLAVTYGSRSLRAAEVGERASRLANVLHELGVQPGERVGIAVPNCAETMELEFGCAIAGATRVALNVRLSVEAHRRTLERMGAKALVYSGEHEELAAAFAEDVPGAPLVRLALEDEAPGDPIGRRYEDLLARACARAPSVRFHDDELYCLFSTSGTSGQPKGVMLSHRAQLAVARNLLVEFGRVTPGDSILLPQPLSHGGGFFLLPWFLSGAHCVVTRAFDPVAAWEQCQRHSVDTIKLVPTMLIDMIKAGVEPTRDYAPRQIIYGAAPMPHQWLAEAMRVFGPVLAQLYGQAEAPMCITVLSAEDHRDEQLSGSAGRPFRGVDARVVDGDDRDVAPGEVGEVIVRGPHMMDGYWQDPEQTAAVLRGGYVRTRDSATVDERGYVFLLGRTDEMINSGGFNIAPRVVERALHEHPAIAEAAVVGVPHDRLGQTVKAYVVLRPGETLDADEVVEYCRPKLGMQRPRQVEFLPVLPKNAYGKVSRAELAKPVP